MQVTSHRLFELIPDIDLPSGQARVVQFDQPMFKMTPKERADAQRERAFSNANQALRRKFDKIAEERKGLIIGRLKRFGPKDMHWLSTHTKIPYKAVRTIVLKSVERGELVRLNTTTFAMSGYV